MADYDWLRLLEPGEEVAMVGPGTKPWARLGRVERVTPTQTVVGGRRFNKIDGHQIGGGSSRLYLDRPERQREAVARARRRDLLQQCRSLLNADDVSFTIEQLEAALRALGQEPQP